MMTKRLTAILLALALLLGVLPGMTLGVSAAGTTIVVDEAPAESSHTAHDETWAELAESQLPASSGKTYLEGTYYLPEGGFTFLAPLYVANGKSLTICLNGQTLTGTSRKFYVEGTLTICDCIGTGALTGGTVNGNGGAITAARGGTVNLCGGKIYGNSTTSSSGDGAGIYIQGGDSTKTDEALRNGGIVNMWGGEIYGNSAKRNGGAVWVGGTNSATGAAAGQFNMYGGTIGGGVDAEGNQVAPNSAVLGGGIYVAGNEKTLGGIAQVAASAVIDGNRADTSGGGIYAQGAADVTIEGSTISNNAANGKASEEAGGGAIYAATNSTVTVSGSSFTGNAAPNGKGGAIGTGAGSAVTVSDSTVTGNSARQHAGINVYGTEENGTNVTLDGVTVQGNTAVYDCGGIYLNGWGTLTLSGKTVITENTYTDNGPVERNVYLAYSLAKSATSKVLIGTDGLDEGSQIGIYMSNSRINNGFASFTEELEGVDQYTEYFVSNLEDYEVIQKAFKLQMAAASNGTEEHSHCICGKEATEEHLGCDKEALTWTAWEKTDSLPTAMEEGVAGYYLISDVILAAETGTLGDVNLCLNGYVVKAASGKRHIRIGYNTSTSSSVPSAHAILNLTDCNKNAGGLTGGNPGSYGGSLYVALNATLNMYGGRVYGNTGTQGGAIYMQQAPNGNNNGGVANIYGGEITGNTATQVGGAIRYNGKTTTEGQTANGNPAELTIYGGLISGNSTNATNSSYGQGGAIYALNYAKLNIRGGTIEGNTSQKNGALHLDTTVELTISGAPVIQNNTLADGSVRNLYMSYSTDNETGCQFDATGMTGGKVGIYMTDGRRDSKLALSKALNGNDVTRYFVSDRAAYGPVIVDDQLYLATAVIGDELYFTATAAIKASSAEGYAKLLANVGTLNATGDVYLDLNGKTLTTMNMGEYTLYGIDTSNDDYDGCGSITTVTGTVSASAANGSKTYVAVANESSYSFHRVDAAINSRVLRYTEGLNGAAGFRANFSADETVAAKITDWGWEVGISEEGVTDAASADIVWAGNQPMSEALKTFAAGSNKRFIIYKNILSGSTPNEDAKKLIWAKPYITIGDVTVKGAAVSTSLQSLVNAANGGASAKQLSSIKAMLKDCLDQLDDTWTIDNIVAAQ